MLNAGYNQITTSTGVEGCKGLLALMLNKLEVLSLGSTLRRLKSGSGKYARYGVEAKCVEGEQGGQIRYVA